MGELLYELRLRFNIYYNVKRALELKMNLSEKTEFSTNNKCSQCTGLFFTFAKSLDGYKHPLCLACWVVYRDMLLKIEEQNIRGINFALSSMEDISGIPSGAFKRYEVPATNRATVIGDLILNNIRIDRSAIGLINTGTILGSVEHIDTNISYLSKDQTMQSFQEALKDFTESVLKSTDATNEQKGAILELMSAISDEICKSKKKQSFTVTKALLKNMQEFVSGLGCLHTMWQNLHQIILRIFS